MATTEEKEPLFEPIAVPKRNFEIVEASIRKAIYNGTLAPGQKLPNEFELAQQFNVGRSAVREALKVLELAGLLVVRRGYNGGTFVAPPSFEEANEATTLSFQPGNMQPQQLLDACLTIEPRAAELAAVHASELELSDLSELLQQLEQEAYLPARYLTAVADVHLSIAEMAHNAVFKLAVQAMRTPLIQELNRFIGNQSLRQTVNRDLKMIGQAILNREEYEAGELMRHHLQHLADWLLVES
ncbi:FadR/GntR family transcriptional regulator [Thermogemmatispora sp.]|uniref:FadR/GntR family transcriptional regulator n=1 Tax=Thermogemmatispora sp. TaxID=1968838 RepID=UPI0035E44243